METTLFRKRLLRRIARKAASIAVLGIGTIGLQVALAFSRAGFGCTGVDTDSDRVAEVNSGIALGHDARTNMILAKSLRIAKFRASAEISLTEEGPDFVILCLPTPLTDNNEPDLTFLTDACAELSNQNLRGKCVVLESSVYPGVTRDIIRPKLEQGGYVAGADFGLAHSPERIDLGSSRFPIERIPKLVGGINRSSAEVTSALYKAVLSAPVINVDSVEIAESAKLLENSYRFVNICLINELELLFEELHIDTFDVVEAASTKPFAFMPHYPGPGVGGHCLPKDSFYLISAGKKVGKTLTLVEAATLVNQRLPGEITSRIERALERAGKTLRGARIAVLGLAYKRNVNDSRRSPVLPIVAELMARGAATKVYDPLVSLRKNEVLPLDQTQSLREAIRHADVILLATDHDLFRRIDLASIRKYVARSPIIFDARNFWDRHEATRMGYSYLGIGKPFSLPGKIQAKRLDSKRRNHTPSDA